MRGQVVSHFNGREETAGSLGTRDAANPGLWAGRTVVVVIVPTALSLREYFVGTGGEQDKSRATGHS